MKTRIAAVVLALATMLMAVALGWRAARGAAAANAEEAKVREETRALAAQLAKAEAMHAEVSKAHAELRRDATRSASTSPAASSQRRTISPGEATAAKDEVMKNPELQLLDMAAKRVELAATYGPFFRRRGLSAERAEQIIEALARYDAQSKDVAAVARAAGLRTSDPAARAQQDKAAEELRAAVRGILEEPDYAAWEEHHRASNAWTAVNRFAGLAAVSGLPISIEQGERLAAALARADPRYAHGENVELNRINWARAEAELQPILTPEQWTLYLRTGFGRQARSGAEREASNAMNEALRKYAEKRASEKMTH